MKDIRDIIKSGSIYKYLKAQVGRPWNKVYSDLCTVAGKYRHEVEDRVRWNVEKNCEIIDGEIYSFNMRWLGRRPVDGLYVHPTTGILSYVEYQPKYSHWQQPRPWEREINYISLKDGKWLATDEHGDWYEHWIEETNEGYRPHKYDAETKQYSVDYEAEVKYTIKKTEHKRELNHKEIQYMKENLLRYGTNKDMLARLNGTYIPAYKWK